MNNDVFCKFVNKKTFIFVKITFILDEFGKFYNENNFLINLSLI